MPCAKGSYCSICEIAPIRRLIALAEECNKTQTDWQYAAINSYEPITGIPMISSDKVFASTPRKHISCVTYLSSLSSFISVLHSLASIPNIVHFGKPDSVSFEELIRTTNSMRRRPGCYTLAMEFDGDKPQRLHIGERGVSVKFSDHVVSVVRDMLQEPDTMCWHWTNDSAWIANVLQPSADSLWVCHNACEITRNLRLSGTSSVATGIPLHSSPSSGDTMMFNTGAPTLDTRSSVNGAFAESVKSVASEFLECVMKDGKCYSCSRVCQIHSDIRRTQRQNMAQSQQVLLSQQFMECLKI